MDTWRRGGGVVSFISYSRKHSLSKLTRHVSLLLQSEDSQAVIHTCEGIMSSFTGRGISQKNWHIYDFLHMKLVNIRKYSSVIAAFNHFADMNT